MMERIAAAAFSVYAELCMGGLSRRELELLPNLQRLRCELFEDS